MKPSDVSRAIRAVRPTRQPLFLWGPPGVGKSQLVAQAASAEGLEVIDIRAVTTDPVDWRGLPSISAGKTTWAPPEFLPWQADWQGIVLLDELPQAPPLVMSALLELTLDRRLGNYSLPAGAWVIAAGNRAEDRAGSHRLISSLSSRFVHLDVSVDAEDWQSWAAAASVDHTVRSYLRHRPGKLHDFDPSRNDRAFACPRSWEVASRLVATTPDDLLLPVLAGAIGEGSAAEYIGYRRVCASLPDPSAIVADPLGAPVPTEPAVLYALAGSLAEACRAGGARVHSAVARYCGRLPADFGCVLMRDAATIGGRAYLGTPEAGEWLRQHGQLFARK